MLLSTAKRQVVQPARRKSPAEVLRAERALLVEIAAVLNRRTLANEGPAAVIDALRPGKAGDILDAVGIPLFGLDLKPVIIRITGGTKAVDRAEIRVRPPRLYRAWTRLGLVRQRRPGQAQSPVPDICDLRDRAEADRLL